MRRPATAPLLALIALLAACGQDEDELIAVGAPDTIALDLADQDNLWFCPEVQALADAGTLVLDGYHVRYDWGEDLADLDDPPTADALDYSDVITVSIPAGGRYTFCAVLVPLEVVDAIEASSYWRRADPGPTSFDAEVRFAGRSRDRAVAAGARVHIDVGYGLP